MSAPGNVRGRNMTDPASIAGVKLGTATAIAAGSFVAGLLMQGQPWYVRLTAGLCGAAAAVILTPILTPIAYKGWLMAYEALKIPADELSRDAVSGFVGFAAGLTGIDLCRAIIDRTKGMLSVLRLPWVNRGSKGD